MLPHSHGICWMKKISNASYCNPIHTYSLKKSFSRVTVSNPRPRRCKTTTLPHGHGIIWKLVITNGSYCKPKLLWFVETKIKGGGNRLAYKKNKIKKFQSEHRDWIAHRIYVRKWYFLCLICWTQALCLNWNTGYMDFS
jgi:hypothetical protein